MANDGGKIPAPFACAPGMKIEAHERLSELQFRQMGAQLERLETMIERLERRLWLTVYGVVAVILTQAVEQLLTVAP